MRNTAVFVLALAAAIAPMMSAASADATRSAVTPSAGADFWERLEQDPVGVLSVDSRGTGRHALDAAFGGYLMNGEESISADIVVPEVTCPDLGTDRVNRKDQAVVPAAVEVGGGPVNGGAGVIAGCDYDGLDGPGVAKYLPVLFLAGREYDVVDRSTAAGDVLRAVFVADPLDGTAISSVQNLTQGWTEATAPFPYVPGGYVEVGDRRIRRDPFPGFRQFIPLPQFRRNSIEDVVADGVALTTATGQKVDMVLPISGTPQIVPSNVTDGRFDLVRRI